MPRKPPILSNEDLQAILNRPNEMPQLLEWARGELKRRKRAGILGGRPKGTTKASPIKETHYEDFEEA